MVWYPPTSAAAWTACSTAVSVLHWGHSGPGCPTISVFYIWGQHFLGGGASPLEQHTPWHLQQWFPSTFQMPAKNPFVISNCFIMTAWCFSTNGLLLHMLCFYCSSIPSGPYSHPQHPSWTRVCWPSNAWCPQIQITDLWRQGICVLGSRMWNNLPLDLRIVQAVNSFKTSLKTYLFSIACEHYLENNV